MQHSSTPTIEDMNLYWASAVDKFSYHVEEYDDYFLEAPKRLDIQSLWGQLERCVQCGTCNFCYNFAFSHSFIICIIASI